MSFRKILIAVDESAFAARAADVGFDLTRSLNAEVAIVKFDGEGQLNLAGWQLKDSNGNTFTFPQITLYPNGAVQVHTSSGTGTVIDLYWNMGDPVWQSGEDAKLYDAQGNLRAVYRVP